MNTQENTKQKKLEERIAYLEKNRRFVQNALEMALSMGDFLEIINGKKDIKQILQATQKRIEKIIPFETCVLYLINEENQSDFIPAVFDPDQFEGYVKKEIEFMIDEGSFAWALREKKRDYNFIKRQYKTICIACNFHAFPDPWSVCRLIARQRACYCRLF